MTPDQHDPAVVAASLTGAHRLLAERIGSRWIKGTGFCHRSVGHDLEFLGLVESRRILDQRQIRATTLGLLVKAYLQGNPHA